VVLLKAERGSNGQQQPAVERRTSELRALQACCLKRDVVGMVAGPCHLGHEEERVLLPRVKPPAAGGASWTGQVGGA
jgi:hypothetical protein